MDFNEGIKKALDDFLNYIQKYDVNKSSTKGVEFLRNNLNEYKGILTFEILNYLNSLIGSEISALNQDVISDDVMNKLSELPIYRKIVIYNIYNRVMNILKEFDKSFDFKYSPTQGLGMFFSDSNGKKYDVFSYYPNEKRMSNIVLKQTIIDATMRQQEIDRLYRKLEEIKSSEEEQIYTRRGLLHTSKKTKMKYLGDLIKELDPRSVYNGDIQYLTSKEDYFINRLLGKDGLQVRQDFVEKPAYSLDDICLQSIQPNCYPSEVERNLTKKLVKTYPHTTISNFIKYY